MDSPEKDQRQFALQVVDQASVAELEGIKRWLESLIFIKGSQISNFEKAKRSVAITYTSKVVWPVLRIISRKLKKSLGDDRSNKGRFGITGIVVGLTCFGGQSAGIAALGGAIGVPLWIVLGSGALFAGHLIEEIQKKKMVKDNVVNAEYEVID